MYLRETKRRNRDGSTVSYLQLAHSERHPVTGVRTPDIVGSFMRRSNATRTVAVDTPVSAPIAANDHPRRSSSRISGP